MAEAFANRLSNGRVHAYSAGSHPLGYIVPETLAVMDEKGITLEGQWSKSLGEVPLHAMDVVISMGWEVSSPALASFEGKKIQWSIPDPYGDDLTGYREVRDMIEEHVKSLLSDLNAPDKEKRIKASAPTTGSSGESKKGQRGPVRKPS